MSVGIFAIMCPHCGAPCELPHDALPRAAVDSAADDLIVCSGCACAFVVRFGHVLAIPRPVERGVG
ncbi:MAG: hypothetical protein ACRDZZ_09865 [Ilumatobacteraceae bacterium]